MITKELLKSEIDALPDTQILEHVYRIIQNFKQSSTDTNKHSREAQQQAMADFFGMHKALGIDSVEDELRLVRKGRRSLWDDI